MLDRNFNELDNDFITIWSQVLLREDYKYGKTMAPKGLIQLVTLGQINAMQCYPCFYNYDARLLSNHPLTQNLEIIEGYDYHLLKLSMMQRKRHDCKKFKEHSPYSLINIIIQKTKALMSLATQYTLHSNPIFLEQCYELKNNHSLFPSRMEKQLRNELESNYQQNPNDPTHAFIYAKFLHSFGNKKDKVLAQTILTKLSERKLSDTVINLIKQDRQTMLSHEKAIREEYCTDEEHSFVS